MTTPEENSQAWIEDSVRQGFNRQTLQALHETMARAGTDNPGRIVALVNEIGLELPTLVHWMQFVGARQEWNETSKTSAMLLCFAVGHQLGQEQRDAAIREGIERLDAGEAIAALDFFRGLLA